jgi:starvation-inducible outer membrane lipoprotein
MVSQRLKIILCSMAVVALIFAVLPVSQVQAKQPTENRQNANSLTAAQAAAKAKARHGGKVLKVTPKGRGYKVKLLTDSGRVLTVMIKD